MDLLDFLIEKKARKPALDFSDINSPDKALRLCREGTLFPLNLVPSCFGGEETARNTLYVPAFVVERKKEYDDIAQGLLQQGRVSEYKVVPEYRGRSLVPISLTITAKGETTFSQKIEIW